MKRVLVLSVLASSLALGACSGGTAASSTDSTSQSAAATTKAPIAFQARAAHVKLVTEALGDVALQPDQRAQVEAMAKDADARAATGRQAHVDLANAVAAQIEAGAIDRTALQPKIDAVVAAGEAAHPADRDAMMKLHALLTPEQRAAFVDALEARGQAQHDHHDMHARMQEWATALSLTDDQKQQIHALMADGMKGHHGGKHGDGDGGGPGGPGGPHGGPGGPKQMLESFKSDTFNPPEPPADAKRHETARSEHFLGMAEKVLPILTPEQRKIAADRIRAKAASGDVGHFE